MRLEAMVKGSVGTSIHGGAMEAWTPIYLW
jgi:hypothetical protein